MILDPLAGGDHAFAALVAAVLLLLLACRVADVGDPLALALDFEKPFKSANTIDFFLTPEGPDATRVRWTMTGPKTLATKVMGLFTSMDKMVGPDFEKGLARLKDVVETRSTS